MIDDHEEGTILAGSTLNEYFLETLDKAVRNQDASINEHSKFYLLNLLVDFSETDRLFQAT